MITIMTEEGGITVYNNSTDKIEMVTSIDIAINIDETLCYVTLDLIDGSKLSSPIRDVQFGIYTNGGYSIVGMYPDVCIMHRGDSEDPDVIPESSHKLGRIQNIKISMDNNSTPMIKMTLDIADSYHNKEKFMKETDHGNL